ncbi:MAG: DUF2318 domain-containing protein [Desulfobacterales bacterium]|nr:DUF2318 domain-containing protein [Desulfobacterales bacterium]
MSKKKRKFTSDEIRAEKKAALLNEEKRSKLPLIAIALCAVFVAAGATMYTVKPFGKDSAPSATSVTAAPHADQVEYSVARFNDGKAQHFTYTVGQHTIIYFVLKSSDGVVRAAFDACDVCWPAGKGYVQQGDQMICRNCGRKFDSVRINEVKGGCNPAPLNRRIEGDRLIIQKADILDGLRYFNFSKKV